MLTKINGFPVGAVAGQAELNPEKPAFGGSRNIYIDYTVAHFKVVQDRRSAIEENRLTALILGLLGLSFETPVLGVRRCGQRLRSLGMARGVKDEGRENGQQDLHQGQRR